jgi:hypothetical protein
MVAFQDENDIEDTNQEPLAFSHSIFSPEKIGLGLHQETADPDEVRKLAQVGIHYLFDVGVLCAERKMT